MKFVPSQRRERAITLVLVLIILTLLSIVVVGFLSSSTADSVTTQAFASKAQAELAAQAATAKAMSLVVQSITQHPDSVTAWESLTPRGGGLLAEGTGLYYWDPVQSTTAQRYFVPLYSTGKDPVSADSSPFSVADKTAALGTDAWTDTNTVDMNRPRFNGDKNGWIGTRTPLAGQTILDADENTPSFTDASGAKRVRPPFRARWVELKDQTVDAATAKTIGRYAFWVEDESFRANLNQVGAVSRKLETDSPGQRPLEMPMQGVLQSAMAPASLLNTFPTTAVDLRNQFLNKRLPELRAYNQVNEAYPIADAAKFYTTIFSEGLNVARNGAQRVNLNGMGMEALNPSRDVMQKQVDQIWQTIMYQAPKFGQRFYRNSNPTSALVLDQDNVVTTDQQRYYMQKLAANIRDYIDPDTQPTIIDGSGQVREQKEPLQPFNAASTGVANEIIAQGKEAAPFLQETVAHYRASVTGTPKSFTAAIDYYVEVWNMTGRDIYAAPQADSSLPHLNNAFVLITDQVDWVGTSSKDSSVKRDLLSTSPDVNLAGDERDVEMNLTEGVQMLNSKGASVPGGVVFKAGKCTVLTTDPDGLTTAGWTPPNPATTYYCSKFYKGNRKFSGPMPTGTDTVKALYRDTSGSDYGTGITLGNKFGILDSAPYGLAQSQGGSGGPIEGPNGHGLADLLEGGSLLGNLTSFSQTGDPRTNNEQLQVQRYTGGGTSDPDQTRYYNDTGSPRGSLGYPFARYVVPQDGSKGWKDYYNSWPLSSGDQTANSLNADTAPAYIADAPLKSIGQLGDIFDPARIKGTGAVVYARGGGRTLKIGQPDDLTNRTTAATATSRQWAAWKLVDFFSTTNTVELPGLININGLRRDNGAAFRTACYGLIAKAVTNSASSSSAPTVATPTLDMTEGASSGIQKLVDAAITRIITNDPALPSYSSAKVSYGPFSERGELSDLDLFNNNKKELLSAVDMSTAFDRTREELSRRLLELVTTRGNVFSVYVVGQAIQEGPAPQRKQQVTATRWQKLTFRMVPVWKTADGADSNGVKQEDWTPSRSTDPATIRNDIKGRFTAPDHYDIQVLQVSY